MEILYSKESGEAVKKVVNDFYLANGSDSLARGDDLYFLAKVQGKIIGSVRYCREENLSLLRSMFVSKEYQRCGVGKMLLSKFVNDLEEKKIRNVYCLPYPYLEKFYAGAGFKCVNDKDIPLYLQKRINSYKNHGSITICMRRP